MSSPRGLEVVDGRVRVGNLIALSLSLSMPGIKFTVISLNKLTFEARFINGRQFRKLMNKVSEARRAIL